MGNHDSGWIDAALGRSAGCFVALLDATRFAAALLVGVLFLTGSARAQGTGANVPEYLETATLYVDTNTGSDSNPGTQQLPLKTISAAAAIAAANSQNKIGTAVMIDPGTYRESVSVALASGQVNTNSPITFEATPGSTGSVTVSGADIWGGWTQSSLYPQLHTNPWPYQWGDCAPSAGSASEEPDILLRREMIFINGTLLTQVLSLNELTNSQFTNPGSFYVDEIGGLVYVWPPSGTDMTTATVEVSTRPNGFSIDGWSYVVLRGLTFQYANSCRFDTTPGGQAVTVVATKGNPGSNNIWLDNDIFVWNNSQGLNVANPATSITVGDPLGSNTVANHNGQSGFQAFDLDNVVWQNSQASFNNWRGAQGAFYNWNSAGLHSYGSHDTSFVGITSNFNQTYGMHWDTDHENVLAQSLISSNNIDSAHLIEASEGPMTISGSYLCSSVLLNDGGLKLRDAQLLTMTNNFLYDNSPSQILVTGTPGGASVLNWQTQQTSTVFTWYLTLGGAQGTGNIIESIDGAQNQQVFQDANLGGTDWSNFLSQFHSDYNTWYNPNPLRTAIFTIPIQQPENFHNWKTITTQDADSNTNSPGNVFGPCQVTADATDYWFTVTSSSVLASAGTPATFTVTITPLDGFTGTVTLGSDGLANVSGASGSWSQNTITGSGSATFTVTVSNTTPSGDYPVVLLANSGNLTHTATIDVLANSSVSLTRNNLNFGSIRAATSSVAQTVNLTNAGSTTLTNISVRQPTSPAFAIQTGSDTCTGMSLATGASCSVSLVFSPPASLAAGPQSGTFSISDSDLSSPQTIALTGLATVAPLTLTPSSLDFGSVQLGSNSAQTVTLTNNDSRPLIMNGMVIVGPNPADFAETNNCGSSVAAGAYCTISVTFTPAAVGTRSATVVIEDDAAGNPQSLSLTGTGLGVPAATVSTTILTFADQLVGTTSPPQNVTLTNTGTGTLSITGITTSGDFGETNPCGTSLAAGSSCTISVTFTPTATGTRTGTLTITDDAAGSPQTVSLTGTGVQPAVTLAPASLKFNTQLVGTSSPQKQVTLTNTGTATLTISNISVTGANSSDFPEANTCGTSLAADASCTMSVTFTPTAAGTRSASVSISDNAPASPQNVSLTGAGTAVKVSPPSLTFGSVTVGQSSPPQTTTITNTGAANLGIMKVGITGSGMADFSETKTCGGILGAGQSCSISVTFTPLAKGNLGAMVSVTDTGGGSPQTVALAGKGR
ncbi:MAG TPA: choice-of-anchor D domain-containing protein [Terriglobia bacterium]